MKPHRLAPRVLAACLLFAASAWAAETGSISGTVFDQNGQPVEGAAVRVSGDKLPGGRTAATGVNGTYSFPLLLPGTYTIEVEKAGVGTSKRQAVVEVDRDTQVEVVLGLQVQEAIQVVSSMPAVDLKTTELNFNYNRETIEALPLERSYRGLLQLMPGVAENRSIVGPAAGGSRQDNTYLIDGVNVTNPGYGYLGMEMNELDVAEFNVKRGGISAEFGRSAGAVTNAVSKSGTNQLSGAARLELMPEAFVADYENPAFPDDVLRTIVNPAASLGGPVLRDKVFFYGSARYFRETKWDRTNRNGQPLPDEKRTGHELFGKLTGTPNPHHLLNVSFRDRPNENKNASLDSGRAATIGTTDDNSSRVANASWAYFLSDRSILDVRYVYAKEKNESRPLTDLGYLPTPFSVSNLALMGQYSDPALNNLTVGGFQYHNAENYRRHETRATFTHLLDVGGSSHEVKAGLGYEFAEYAMARRTNGWGLLSRLTVSGQPVIRARYYHEQPAQIGQGRTWSVFVQDNITIGTRLTVNAGLLLNRDLFDQEVEGSGGCPVVLISGGAGVYRSSGDRCTFLEFGFGDEIQPRLGVNYNVRRDAGDKVYANWGRFYNMDQKSSGRSLAPRRVFQREARFNAITGELISDGPLASTTGKLIDPDLQPTYSDEVLFGYATPFAQHYSVDAFFIYREANNFIEDVPTRINGTSPDSGPYGAANLPCQRWAACRGAEAKRSYKAFTVEVARQLTDRVASNVSYTWSRFEGNFDLDYSVGAVFNTSSFIQDGPGTDVQEPNRYGPLRQDRPHVLKLFGSIAPTDALTFGGYLRVQSGAPWNARGRDWEGAVLNYLEPAGSRRNPAWTNFDVTAAYRRPTADRSTLMLELRVLNLFGNQTRLLTEGQQYLDLNTIPTPPYFAPYTQPNPFFGTAAQYAPPRRLVLTAQMTF